MNNEAKISQQPTANSHNNVLVSIIIPAYNTATYIYRAIESSLRQTHKNVEIVIVDDGSTDDTLKIVQEYAARDERVRVFTQENAGVSSARNLGIREAKGEFLMFLDSDDWLEDDAAEILVKAQLEHPDMLIACNLYYVNFVDNDTSNTDIFLRYKYYNNPPIQRTVAETLDAYIFGIQITSYAKLFRADVIRKYNLRFNEGLHFGEDMLFAFEYLIKMQGSFSVEKPLFNILHRPGSAIHSQRRKTNKADPFTLFVENPEVPPDAWEAAAGFAGSMFMFRYKSVLTDSPNLESILSARKKARKYLRYYLAHREKRIPKKIYNVLVSYLPIPLARSIVRLMRSIKNYRRSRNTNKVTRIQEAIPYW